MRRTLVLTAVTAAMALSLAACGAERTNNGVPDSGSIAGGTTATDTMRDSGGTGTGTHSGAATNRETTANELTGVTGYALGGPNSSVYAAANNRGVAQEQAAARSRLAQMMENARVHDTDGFLLDGENASNSTF